MSSSSNLNRALPSVTVQIRAGDPVMAADLVAADVFATMYESGFDARIDLADPSPGSQVWEIRYRDASGRRFKSEVDRPRGADHTPISRAILALQSMLDLMASMKEQKTA